MKSTSQLRKLESDRDQFRRYRMQSWMASLKHSWHTALRVDRSQVVILTALRSMFGFILPLAVGVATNNVEAGVAMAGGASSIGSVGLLLPYRSSLKVKFWSSIAYAFSAGIGALVGPYPILTIVAITLWGFLAGLLVTFGQSAMIIGIQATLALIVLTHFGLSPIAALSVAVLLFSGAMLQTALSLIPLPNKSVGARRNMMADLYHTLADYAQDHADFSVATRINAVLTQAESLLSSDTTHRFERHSFYHLFDEAERLRLSMTIFFTGLQALLSGNTTEATERDQIVKYMDEIVRALSTILEGIAYTLRSRRATEDLQPVYKEMDRSFNKLMDYVRGSKDASPLLQIQLPKDYKALRFHLLTAQKLPVLPQKRQKNVSRLVTIPRQSYLRLRDPFSTLRANLTFRSAAFRHAVRLGVAMFCAAILYHVVIDERSYWIPLTTLLVLRSDFTSTFSRGVARLLGTMLGVALTSALVIWFVHTDTAIVIAEAVVTFFAYALLAVNYGLFSIFVTAQIILLLELIDPHPFTNEFLRVEGTVIGGCVALLVYALWPTLEHRQISENISRRLDTLRRYFAVVMDAYVHPNDYDPNVLQQCRQNARIVRTNTEASFERALHEPGGYHIDRDLAKCLFECCDDFAKSVLSLEVFLLEANKRQALPMLTPYVTQINDALRALAMNIRHKRLVGPIPQLDGVITEMEQIKSTLRDERRAELHDFAFVLFIMKRIVITLNTMGRLIESKYEQDASASSDS